MKPPKPGHVRVFVAAGSNVEPEKNLARACAEIAHTWPDAYFSRAYRNVAVGFEGPDFINLVIGFSAAQPNTWIHGGSRFWTSSTPISTWMGS